MNEVLQYFMLGASFMFSAMVAWLFWRKGSDLLSRLVMILMLVMSLGFLKDTFIVTRLLSLPDVTVEFSFAVDMIAVPLYVYILIELCKPGTLTMRFMCLAELPFFVLPVLLIVTRHPVFYYIDLFLSLLLGLTMAIWACIVIPRYNKRLKAMFSFDDDINLKWLQSIQWAFFVLLTTWALSCLDYNPWFEVLYMTTNLVLWIVICFFIYKHKSVVDELHPCITHAEPAVAQPSNLKGQIFERIHNVLINERIYLKPMLKLSDIARAANTNRTYASEYFNAEVGMTFYDHINALRIAYSLQLLADKSKRLDEVAELSGFNSRQSFHRVFLSIKGLTPNEYRNSI